MLTISSNTDGMNTNDRFSYRIDMGDGLMAYAKLSPDVFEELKRSGLLFAYHQELMAGFDYGQAFLRDHKMDPAVPMVPADGIDAESGRPGWLLCRHVHLEVGLHV